MVNTGPSDKSVSGSKKQELMKHYKITKRKQKTKQLFNVTTFVFDDSLQMLREL